MNINQFDINILVNGNNCKLYQHQGKTYLEAKYDSQYELQVKNNTWNRVLLLASVDGLSVLSGTAASENDPGYIIPAYSPLRIKGFRASNKEVGAFKFTSKNNSYAMESGGYNAALNCGVIGFRIYGEYIGWTYHGTYTIQPTRTSDIVFYGNSIVNASCTSDSVSNQTYACCTDNNLAATPNFDVGTTWGQKIESNVSEAEFNKGCLIFSFDIYYASRQALIDMGVPVNANNQVCFPESFPNKYATPPKGWRG